MGLLFASPFHQRLNNLIFYHSSGNIIVHFLSDYQRLQLEFQPATRGCALNPPMRVTSVVWKYHNGVPISSIAHVAIYW
uniref:Uncharacterized protein n=1 Tax=mine drainage metagenome TaxID=410659 RepID=E6QDX4_9ZZZZ